jgi:hypothetical protein
MAARLAIHASRVQSFPVEEEFNVATRLENAAVLDLTPSPFRTGHDGKVLVSKESSRAVFVSFRGKQCERHRITPFEFLLEFPILFERCSRNDAGQ